jgi:hypothetical protein
MVGDTASSETSRMDARHDRLGRRGVAGAALLMLGCTHDVGEAFASGGSATVTTSATAGASSGDADDGPGDDASTTTGDDAPDDTGPDDGTKFDTPPPDGAGAEPGDGEGCTKIDFLFVIDNSSSMGNEQEQLVAAFDGFISTIESEVGSADFHVGVVDTDSIDDDWAEEEWPQSDPCALELGGLLSRDSTVSGGSGFGNACGFASGRRYMTAGPGLADEFACAAHVGIQGDTQERQAGAVVSAVSPGLAASGACNEGFIRPDALLVIVLITDEDDRHSDGDPFTWFHDVVAAKGGIETNVAVLLISEGDPPYECAGTSYGSVWLSQWAELFTHTFAAPVCLEGYESVLADAIAPISEACEGFQPEG